MSNENENENEKKRTKIQHWKRNWETLTRCGMGKIKAMDVEMCFFYGQIINLQNKLKEFKFEIWWWLLISIFA